MTHFLNSLASLILAEPDNTSVFVNPKNLVPRLVKIHTHAEGHVRTSIPAVWGSAEIEFPDRRGGVSYQSGLASELTGYPRVHAQVSYSGKGDGVVIYASAALAAKKFLNSDGICSPAINDSSKSYKANHWWKKASAVGFAERKKFHVGPDLIETKDYARIMNVWFGKPGQFDVEIDILEASTVLNSGLCLVDFDGNIQNKHLNVWLSLSTGDIDDELFDYLVNMIEELSPTPEQIQDFKEKRRIGKERSFASFKALAEIDE